jgi:hypothetical protein
MGKILMSVVEIQVQLVRILYFVNKALLIVFETFETLYVYLLDFKLLYF